MDEAPHATMSAGETIRKLREEAGLSLRELAQMTFVHWTTLSKIEQGQRSLTAEVAEACDKALLSEGTLTAIARTERKKRHAAGQVPQAMASATSPASVLLIGTLPDAAVPGEVSSDFGSGGLPTSASLDPLDRLDTLSIETPIPTSIGWSDVEHVRFITRALALSENMYGGGFSGEAAAAQLRHSAQLLRATATVDVRHAMFEAIGNLSGVVAFSAFDVADYLSANQCFRFSLWCAEEGKSWPLRANTLGDMARVATYLGETDNALSLVEFAQVRSDRISNTARAMLCAVRARLLALQGRYSDARAEVLRADGYFAERGDTTDPPWLSYYDEAEHQGSTGRALIPIAVSTKDVDLAVPRLQAAVDLHDDKHPRSRTFSRTRLASLLMKAGDPREAAHVGRTAFIESQSLRSTRITSEIESLSKFAAVHGRISEVAELREAIDASHRQIGASPSEF